MRKRRVLNPNPPVRLTVDRLVKKELEKRGTLWKIECEKVARSANLSIPIFECSCCDGKVYYIRQGLTSLVNEKPVLFILYEECSCPDCGIVHLPTAPMIQAAVMEHVSSIYQTVTAEYARRKNA